MTPLTFAINAATYAPPLAVAARYAVRSKVEWRDHADALPALVTVLVLAVGLGVMVVNSGR